MKKLFLIFFLGACFLGANAQSAPTSWSLLGNSGTANRYFLGTTDSSSLVFKTDGVERMRLLGDMTYFGIGTNNPLATLHLHALVTTQRSSGNLDRLARFCV